MLVKNAFVFLNGRFVRADVRFEKRIEEIGTLSGDGLDATGLYLVPGLVDVHTHGAMGADTCDAVENGLKEMARFYASRGVSSFCATSMTYDEETLTGVMREAGAYKGGGDAAKCVGINMEGPFISPKKKGAQDAKNIFSPDYAMFERLNNAANGRIRLVDVAPETEGAMEFIKEASKVCAVSLAHTAADYDTAMRAFYNGANHVTHLYNAMEPFLHRSPGVVGAAFDAGAYVELICDGIHLHPAVIRASFALYGANRVCLVSDSMRSAGLPDGEYELGGQPVFVKEGKATLADGTIAGSSTNVLTALQNCVAFGIPKEQALIAATLTPARSIGLDGEIGSIEQGKLADLLLTDESFNLKTVFIEGRELT
ncbi:MAG TPA: N-acetylglucosamine-6-phosphate deacetylase [Clostridia bacterium]|nr:N-acetylglucosamine-6-phosphate deacetylase [Clostridia bacterium]